MAEAVVDVGAAGDAAAFHEELRLVGERVLDRGVEVLIDVVTAIMGAAHAQGMDRPCVLHPAAVVDDVDEEVAVAPAAGPEEAMEPPDLVFHVGDVGRLRRRLHGAQGAVHVVPRHENDVADLAVLDPRGQLLQGAAVPGMIDAYLEVLRGGLFGELDDLAGRRAVGRDPGFSMKTCSPFWMA